MVKNKYSMVRSFLQRKLKKKVKLTTTKNRDTLIFFENQDKVLDVKINSQFLRAPFSVLDLLVDFIKTNSQATEKELKKYITEYSPRKTKKKAAEPVEKISHLGKVYNLKVLFDMINEKYFDSEISANITWGRSTNSRPKKSIRFGSYDESKDIIRVNPELDKSFVPKFFIGYIIYHEMLHCKLGIIKGKPGKRNEIHSSEFKELEKKYFAFNKAREWEKQNREKFLTKNSGAGT